MNISPIRQHPTKIVKTPSSPNTFGYFIIGNSYPIIRTNIQFKNTTMDTPFSGRISGMYIHTIGPKDKPKAKIYIKMKYLLE